MENSSLSGLASYVVTHGGGAKGELGGSQGGVGGARASLFRGNVGGARWHLLQEARIPETHSWQLTFRCDLLFIETYFSRGIRSCCIWPTFNETYF